MSGCAGSASDKYLTPLPMKSHTIHYNIFRSHGLKFGKDTAFGQWGSMAFEAQNRSVLAEKKLNEIEPLPPPAG